MKYLLVLACLWLQIPTAEARLGESLELNKSRYGDPIFEMTFGSYRKISFEKNGFLIFVYLKDDKAVAIRYSKVVNSGVINALLKLELGNGKLTFSKTEPPDKVWFRDDDASAIYEPFSKTMLFSFNKDVRVAAILEEKEMGKSSNPKYLEYFRKIQAFNALNLSPSASSVISL